MTTFASPIDGIEHTPLDELWSLLARPPWQADALCHEYPGLDFFPERGGDLSALRHVCARCSVREECLAFALAGPERHGVWGGTSEKQRRAMRRRDTAPDRSRGR